MASPLLLVSVMRMKLLVVVVVVALGAGCAPAGDERATLEPGGKADGSASATITLTPGMTRVTVDLASCDEAFGDDCEITLTARIDARDEVGFTDAVVASMDGFAIGQPRYLADVALLCLDEHGVRYNDLHPVDEIDQLTATLTEILPDGRKVIAYTGARAKWATPKDVTCTATVDGWLGHLDRLDFDRVTIELTATWK
jgi:hypothetical protein